MAAPALSVACVLALALAAAAAPAAPVARQAPAPAAAAAECFSSCAFTFCPYQASITPGTPDRPLSGAICSRDPTVIVGHVDETGEALLVTPAGTVPISQYAPAGLRQRFTPSFWKAFGLPVQPGSTDLSGVGHETPQQNQAAFLAGRCFVLPLREYQVLNRAGGSVIANVRPNQPLVQCVAFSVGAFNAAALAANAAPAAPVASASDARKSAAAVAAAAPFFSGAAAPTEAPTAAAVSGESSAPSATAGPHPIPSATASMQPEVTPMSGAVSPESSSPTNPASVYAPTQAYAATVYTTAMAYTAPATDYKSTAAPNYAPTYAASAPAAATPKYNAPQMAGW
jgi:hypothetical protein